MIKLSVLVLTYNSYEDFYRLISMVVENKWDVIISDQGSVDGTSEYIESIGGTILDGHGKTLGQRKQELIERAKSEWVLILDTDERVSLKLREEIEDILTHPEHSKGINGYRIPYQNHVFGKPVYNGGENYSKVRLFRRTKGSVDPFPLHEEIHVEGKIGELNGKIFHYSYRNPIQLITKFTTYAWVAAGEKIQQREPVTLKKLLLYGPHMFWARFVKEKGYMDGWRGLVLANAFGYMEKLTYWFLLLRKILPHVPILTVLLFLQGIILTNTTFIDWPEMIFYPWLSHKGLVLYKDYIIGYPPGAVWLLSLGYKVLGYSLANYRTLGHMFMLMTSTILYFFSYRLCGKKWIAGTSVLFFAYWSFLVEGNTIWFESLQLPFYLIAAYGLHSYWLGKERSVLLLSGISFAIAASIKQTVVWPYMFATGLIVFRNFPSLSKIVRDLFVFLSPLVLSIGVMALYFWQKGIGEAFFYWSYLLPFFYATKDVRYRLMPTISDVGLILPLGVPIVLSVYILAKEKKSQFNFLYIIGWISITFIFAFPRWGMHRLVASVAFSAIMFSMLIVVIVRKFSDHKMKQILIVGLIVFLLGSFRSGYKFMTLRYDGLTQFFDDRQASTTVGILEEMTGGNVAIFGDFDYAYYYFTDRTPIVVPWIQLYPVFAESLSVQQDIIDSIESTNIAYIAYIPFHADRKFFSGYEPDRLKAYIESSYDAWKALPKGMLFRRKATL